MPRADTANDLLTAKAVRDRSRMVFDAGLAGRLAHFRIDLDKMPACAAFVSDTIRTNYPDLKVPPHSRWRHLSANGRDWSERLGDCLSRDRRERLRQRIDLAVTSVLLDAGAGPDWRWRDPVTGKDFARSEGLALASLDAFRGGVFASDKGNPCSASAKGLKRVSTERMAEAFQVRSDNPLQGLEGRVDLLRRLGRALNESQVVYGPRTRIGTMADFLAYTRQDNEPVAIPDLLQMVLNEFGSIWPGRLIIDGVNLGDTWQHPAIEVDGPTRGLIPFHKLSQWLTYSLIEPLQEAGITVTKLDGLTGLAEYRNGGLFIDMDVLVPRDPKLAMTPLTPDQEQIVEWRALTVALLDEIAPLVRTELGVTAEQMPLASILEGGTWSAGRRIAAQKRSGGGPPLTIVSDGTVF